MSRKDFISDHLVDMRKQLRDSYENFHQEKASRNSAEASSAAPVADVSATKQEIQQPAAPVKTISAADKYLPSIRETKMENEREWRELEGRILHDIAATDSQREMLQQKLAELEKFAAVLHLARKRIGEENIAKVQQEYFSARGRWSSFDCGSNILPEKDSVVNSRGDFFISGAIVAGSLIIALVMIGLFS